MYELISAQISDLCDQYYALSEESYEERDYLLDCIRDLEAERSQYSPATAHDPCEDY